MFTCMQTFTFYWRLKIINNISDCEILKTNINNFHWCQNNAFSIKIRKCNSILFYTIYSLINFNYSINDSIINQVQFIKNSSDIFFFDLYFNNHNNYICCKSLKMLGCINCSIHKFNNIQVLIILYFPCTLNPWICITYMGSSSRI